MAFVPSSNECAFYLSPTVMESCDATFYGSCFEPPLSVTIIILPQISATLSYGFAVEKCTIKHNKRTKIFCHHKQDFSLTDSLEIDGLIF